WVEIGTSSDTSFVDPEELPNGKSFSYRVRAEFDDEGNAGLGPWSDALTVTAINQAPAAVADSGAAYTTFQSTVLNIAAPGVLGNDADGDSPAGFGARRALIPGVTPSANGSFTVTTPK